MKLTPEKLTAFCAALAETCQVGKAAAAIGVSRMTAYKWREEIPEFAANWDRALKVGAMALEDEATRRGFDGVEEPVFQGGGQVGTIRKYSDTLAIFLLKAHNPERFRDNHKIDLTGNLQLNSLTDDELRAEIAQILTSTPGALPLTAPAPAAPDDNADLL